MKEWSWSEKVCPLCGGLFVHAVGAVSLNAVYINELDVLLCYPLCFYCHEHIVSLGGADLRKHYAAIEAALLAVYLGG